MAQDGAAAPAVNSQGSCARGGGSVRARSGFGQGSVRLRQRCREGQGCAGQRHWRLSRTGRELWLLLRLRRGEALSALVVAPVTATAVAVGSDHDGGRGWETQGFGRGFTRGGGNMKCRYGHPPSMFI